MRDCPLLKVDLWSRELVAYESSGDFSSTVRHCLPLHTVDSIRPAGTH